VIRYVKIFHISIPSHLKICLTEGQTHELYVTVQFILETHNNKHMLM